MCLVVIQWDPNQSHWLALASNRDEFWQRPTTPLAVWSDCPDIIAGRDQRQNGSWLAVHRYGWFAALTNIRKPGVEHLGQQSRGILLVEALKAAANGNLHSWLEQITAEQIGPFNLLIGNQRQLFWITNFDLKNDRYQLQCQSLSAGTYGLSNAHLDTPWPKTLHAKQQMEAWLNGNNPSDIDALFRSGDNLGLSVAGLSTVGLSAVGVSAVPSTLSRLTQLLTSRQLAADSDLPSTGIPHVYEKALSAAFIETEFQQQAYGTRSSAGLLAVDNQLLFHEISWCPPVQQEVDQSGEKQDKERALCSAATINLERLQYIGW